MPVAQDTALNRRGPTKPHPLSDPDVYLRHAEQSWYAWIRLGIEYPITVCLFVLTAPLVALAALLIKLTSRGPLIYSQVRLGRGGQPFKVYKIRSMYHDCERHSGPRWSNGRDPRVLPLGRIIRVLHIDELPQLWNVLRGEMSLIGPRPERPEFVLKLERSVPRYRERLRVRPGISGLAQVQLPADVDLESVRRKLAYDLYYIENMGPSLDVRICLGTILKMVGVRFSVLRKLFSMPDPNDVEALYWQPIHFVENLPKLKIQSA
jgi:lipopolysaccharide/colanic/teichoic acid biosynthesis glycosyltransferase